MTELLTIALLIAGMLAAAILGATVMFIGLRGVSPAQIGQAMRGTGQWLAGLRAKGMRGAGGNTESPLRIPIEPGPNDLARLAAEEYRRRASFTDYDDLAIAEAFDKLLVAREPDMIDEVMGGT